LPVGQSGRELGQSGKLPEQRPECRSDRDQRKQADDALRRSGALHSVAPVAPPPSYRLHLLVLRQQSEFTVTVIIVVEMLFALSIAVRRTW
jgi:hypothetical protein